MAERARTGSTRPRRRRVRVWVPASLAVLLVVAGYGAADAADLVPGVLTTAPVPTPNPPFPEVDDVATSAPVAVPGADAEANEPDGDALADLTAGLLAQPSVGAGSGVLVTDVLTGAELDGVDADVAGTPASTTKLLTATAAIATAGPEFRFTTRVVRTGPGEIVLVGGGDLTLAAGAGDAGAVVGRAGLADLAEATAQALLDAGESSVSVALDTSYYTGPDMPPRWDDIDLAAGDAMHMTPLAIEIGLLDGQRARSTDPGGDAAAAFVAALAAAGITVTGEVGSAVAPEDATELATVSSAPLEQLVAYTLQHSENILAETLGRLVAHEVGEDPSFAGAGAGVRAALAELDIDVTGLDLADTSGLSSTNDVSPRTLVDTLLAIAEHPRLGAVARGLPVAGLEGTLVDRLREPPAAGLVAAKTGTLVAVVALSGFVTTADGRLLAFAVLVDDVPTGGTAAARTAVDDWIADIAACGC